MLWGVNEAVRMGLNVLRGGVNYSVGKVDIG